MSPLPVMDQLPSAFTTKVTFPLTPRLLSLVVNVTDWPFAAMLLVVSLACAGIVPSSREPRAAPEAISSASPRRVRIVPVCLVLSSRIVSVSLSAHTCSLSVESGYDFRALCLGPTHFEHRACHEQELGGALRLS
ncbi:hypothetical protein [Streptomyces sp. NPDC051554]|uniref:hypothetical protein n=1 Tax=Streptomyces sp. NPDC051554 TaxID=3365656 RepID=UPI0037895A3B